MIQFQKDRSIAEFADQFYLEAQVLTGSGSLTVHDAHIALHSAVKPYKVLYCTLMPELQDNCSINDMVQYLCQCGDTFGPPMPQLSLDPYPLLPSVQKCSRTAILGHYHPGKSPSEVETGLSHSTIDNPSNVPNAELFVSDIGYSGNALNRVIVEDVYTVQTRSQAMAKGEAQAIVSKPYSHQLLDKAPDKGPGPSTDTLHLKGVNIAIPMDAMKAHHPELYGSTLEFLSIADDLDIHLYRPSLTGALINIIFTHLVKHLGLAPNIDHWKQYGTAGLTVTTEQGVYIALPLHFGSLAVLAPAIVLPNNNYDILIGTLFMRQYRVRTDLAADTFEILGQTILLYYCHNKESGTHKSIPRINLAYKNVLVPIQ
ncbi:hypothetical protein DSO57_1029040 [Entomophthora muscae]|uniref:Uncharacterized protein n=1 Tax=Entomophthora muscae TaxID=34485 RepID=A0ACC2SE20_9FUNG|nr:hypothetical protein DSO57_1029040 [Entomophthora muscae]